jgi:hypothetical protein
MNSKKTYFLDLETLLAYLRSNSCLLTAELLLSGQAATGYVTLQEGQVVNYLIRTTYGQQIEGQQAYEHLRKCTQWQVHLQQAEKKKTTILPPLSPSSQPPPTQQTPRGALTTEATYLSQSQPNTPTPFSPTSSPQTPPPLHQSRSDFTPLPLRQKNVLTSQVLYNQPMKQRLVLRMVLAMVNGQRNAEQIKAQLHLPPDVVHEALVALYRLDIIEETTTFP